MKLYPCDRGFLYLNNTMRMLWEQHAAWTRMTIISIVDRLPDENLTTERLLRNPKDIAEVFQSYYGKKVADRLESLLTDHLVLAAELVKAAQAGDSIKAQEIERRWYANADEIAEFLSSINPYWHKESMRQMWFKHLDQVKAQAVARLNGDYAASIAFYDEGEILILQMADELTIGIVKQFPQFFE
ncbi:MAG: acetylglutamate kinase [Zhaonellaceae bacterium]|jgi:hypothetical protein